MKFVLAPDKFKGSLSGMQFCAAVEEGILEVLPIAEIIKLPLADGGDGTIEVVNYYLKGKVIYVTVNNPFFKSIKGSYLYAEASKTAFIEMAEASGVKLLKPEEFDCKNATTLGTGEMIVDAIQKGAENIILGIGGSATNDCGIGMATALGYKFEDENGKELSPVGKNLSKIHHINTNDVPEILNLINFKVACDVTNPLFGQNGAAYVYGPQKGASKEDIVQLDDGLKHISKVFINQFGKEVQNIRGAGAAGGMGAGAMVFLNAGLKPGIDLVKDLVDFDNKIKDADWIITGEGKLDSQTLSGKTIQGVLISAKAHKIRVAALCGSVSLSKDEASDFGIAYSDSVINESKNFDDAMKNSYKYLSKMATRFTEKLSL